jgi:hypothetical protein
MIGRTQSSKCNSIVRLLPLEANLGSQSQGRRQLSFPQQKPLVMSVQIDTIKRPRKPNRALPSGHGPARSNANAITGNGRFKNTGEEPTSRLILRPESFPARPMVCFDSHDSLSPSHLAPSVTKGWGSGFALSGETKPAYRGSLQHRIAACNEISMTRSLDHNRRSPCPGRKSHGFSPVHDKNGLPSILIGI